jgi:hypothetical protein
MKVYLDDTRQTPEGWTRTYTVEGTIDYLLTGNVKELSLDNDLGTGFREGYEVMDWLEQYVYDHPEFPIPKITIHSMDTTRRAYMLLALQSIKRIRAKQLEGKQ